MDLVELRELGLDITLCSCLCWGTGYQMMLIQKDKRTTRDAFSVDWARHYGWPELVVTDQGPEFTGKEFTT